MGTLSSELTALWFAVRDWRTPPGSILCEAGIQPGFRVLDFGCGPGSFSIAAAELVGGSGRVYAVDVDPLALQRVRSRAARKGLENIETVCTDCVTGLETGSVDVVLLYDTYHDLTAPDDVLAEVHRVSKPDSVLSFSDHHMQEDQILASVTGGGLFELLRQGKTTYTFRRMAK